MQLIPEATSALFTSLVEIRLGTDLVTQGAMGRSTFLARVNFSTALRLLDHDVMLVPFAIHFDLSESKEFGFHSASRCASTITAEGEAHKMRKASLRKSWPPYIDPVPRSQALELPHAPSTGSKEPAVAVNAYGTRRRRQDERLFRLSTARGLIIILAAI